ncbi:unnamed protein product [Rotaria magnacalcarata]
MKEEADLFQKRRDSMIDHEEQLSLALQEIEQLKIALNQAEEHAQQESYEPPSELIDLLKRTYHTEEIAFEVKRKLVENSLIIAKEQMNKISKMQKGAFGALRIAHTNGMDNVAELIRAAKERLTEIHGEYVERWNRIGILLSRDDLSNSGLSIPIVYRSNEPPRLHA